MIKNRKGVSPVIAVVLLVSITVVLAATAWVMISNMTQSISEKPPYMTLAKGNLVGSGMRKIEIAGVESNYPITKYSLVLLINDTIDEYSRMDPLFNGTIGNVTFGDQEGELGAGDFFIIDIAPQRTYTIKIFWRTSGNQAGTLEWQEFL